MEKLAFVGMLQFLLTSTASIETIQYRDPLRLDYQTLSINANESLTLSTNYIGSCDIYRMEFFTHEDIVSGSNARDTLTFNTSDLITLPFYNQTYFRITVEDGTGAICSDDLSIQRYYRLLSTGK